MMTPEILANPRVERTHLPVAGMQGAGLTHFRFHGVEIRAENVLGRHRHPLERGMMALIKIFYRMRPAVSAMALGSAQALLDAVWTQRDGADAGAQDIHEALQGRVDAVRRLNLDAARRIDAGEMDGAAVALAKASATELAEEVVHRLPDMIGIRRVAQSRWLMKSFTDVHGYEWMEGSSDMQRLNIFQALKPAPVCAGSI